MLALVQEVPLPDISSWTSLGIGGVLAGVMFYFYRRDREASEKRFDELAKDFRAIIQSNTEAMTALREAIKRD